MENWDHLTETSSASSRCTPSEAGDNSPQNHARVYYHPPPHLMMAPSAPPPANIYTQVTASRSASRSNAESQLISDHKERIKAELTAEVAEDARLVEQFKADAIRKVQQGIMADKAKKEEQEKQGGFMYQLMMGKPKEEKPDPNRPRALEHVMEVPKSELCQNCQMGIYYEAQKPACINCYFRISMSSK